MKPVSHLYIHLPFCTRRCGYCDFFSTTGQLEAVPAYVDALTRELSEYHLPAGALETVYLGGGTPTLLSGALLSRLLQRVRPHLAAGAEVTVEANPETVTPRLAEALAAAGVTRVSLGAQSFDAGLRKNLGRAGSAESIAAAFQALRGAGVGNLGLDLIFGIPGQKPDQLQADLDRALALKPQHISCYELSVRPGSAYARRWQPDLMEDAAAARFYETVVDTLAGAGYRWYETSNFALPGYECRHNLAYWSGADYIGIGAGAWSTVGLERWQNDRDVGGYIAAGGGGDGSGEGVTESVPGIRPGHGALESALTLGLRQGQPESAGCTSEGALEPVPAGSGWGGIRQVEALTPAQKEAERLFLGLRREEGVRLLGTGGGIDPDQLNTLQQNGFIKTEGDKIYLTRAGRFLANEVCARLLREWEEPEAGQAPASFRPRDF